MRTQKTAVATVLMLTGLAHAGSKEPMPLVTIRVENEARVDERLLRGARKETTGILNRAGVGIIWLDCAGDSAPCQRPRGPADFPFRITTQRPTWTSQENLGFTDHAGGDGLAGVNYPAVLKLAEKLNGFAHGITPAAVYAPGFLGAAIAHEIGHLILGANAHSHEGVMRAEWGREQFELISAGRLDFAPDQAKRLPIEVKRRLSQGRQHVDADQQ
jgi:hypothetical protein